MINKPRKFDVFVDSDAFIGWQLETDAHHPHAVTLFENARKTDTALVTSSFVVAETATVLSYRSGQEAARMFLKTAENLPVIFISEALYKDSLTLFRQQSSKGTSVIDCSNVVVMRRFSIPRILSFDKVYHKRFHLDTAA